METLVGWTYGKLKRHGKHEIHNGLLALKGNNPEEFARFKDKITLYPISDYFKEEFFLEKFVVHLPY
jgi:16S rRNA (guanine527-N7)-methyltransferase